jgi:plastocyanin
VTLKLVILVVLAAAVVACDEKENAKRRTLPKPVFGTGTVRGTVKFVGAPPPRAKIANQPCHANAKPLLEENVVVNEDGTLASVFLQLSHMAPSDGSDRPPALLDQVDCRYVPHAIGVQVGQTLRIKSSDPTMHNVHYSPVRNTPANFGQTVAGAEKAVTFDRGEFIPVRCDVHPWMNATIAVFEHPFFDVTGENDGTFEITRVPAGSYKLVAWHERYGLVQVDVAVKENKTVDVAVEYKAP